MKAALVGLLFTLSSEVHAVRSAPCCFSPKPH